MKKEKFANSNYEGGYFINKKTKAFTLIELLAIIVILAIIAVITVPIILNIIENSRKGAATDSAYGYKDAVNKYYITELSKPENQNLILSGQYDVSTGGVLNGSGITNKEIPVSGEKPSAGELHYSNNELKGGCLVIGDYAVIFEGGNATSTAKGDCNDYEFSSENSGSSSNEQGSGANQTTTPLEIGADVDYTTTLNGQTLSNWKVFYIDGDYTYLIYGDYLPNAALSSSFLTTYGLDKYGTYGIYGPNSSPTNFINVMTTKSNWDSLLTGTLNGHAINETSSENVWAIGSPTLELWVESWNDTYPNDTLYVRTDNEEGLNVYYVGDSPNPTDSYINLSNKTGYGNTLYFPHQESIDNGESYGYWLSAASYFEGFIVKFAQYNGSIDGTYSDTYDGSYYAFRPVIKLPTSILNQ